MNKKELKLEGTKLFNQLWDTVYYTFKSIADNGNDGKYKAGIKIIDEMFKKAKENREINDISWGPHSCILSSTLNKRLLQVEYTLLVDALNEIKEIEKKNNKPDCKTDCKYFDTYKNPLTNTFCIDCKNCNKYESKEDKGDYKMNEKNLQVVCYVYGQLKKDSLGILAKRTLSIEELKEEIIDFEETKILLIYNDRFEINYHVNENKLELKTCFGNQLVNAEYMKELQKLYNLVEEGNKKLKGE